MADDTQEYRGVIWLPYKSSFSVYPRIFLGLSGGTAVYQSLVFNLTTGAYTNPHTGGTVISVTRWGNAWRIEVSVTNNGTGNTTLTKSLLPAYNTDGTTTEVVATQGTTEFFSFDVYKDRASFMPLENNTNSTKTVNADTEPYLDIRNWTPGGDVSVEMEVTPFFDDTVLGSAEGMLTPRGGVSSRFVYWGSSVANRVALGDGTTVVTDDTAWSSVGQTLTIKAIASTASGKMNISVDGAAATEANYDGSFNPITAIELGTSFTRAMAIKNVKIQDQALGNAYLRRAA